MKPCPKHFKGNLDSFCEEFVLPNHISTSNIEIFHAELKSYIEKNDINYFVRNLTPSGSSRGTPIRQYKNQVFNCDNAPAMWLYSNLHFNKSIESNFLALAIKNREIPLKDRGARPGEELYLWSTASADPHNFRGVEGGRWKLCHIYSVKQNLPTTPDWLLKRFVRLIHPLNLFCFPRPMYNQKGYYPIGADLGEAGYICEHIRLKLRNKVGLKIYNEFEAMIGASSSEEVGTKKLSNNIELVLNWQEMLPENTKQSQSGKLSNMIIRLSPQAKCEYRLTHSSEDHRNYSVRKIKRGNGIREYNLDIEFWYSDETGENQPVGKFRFDLEELYKHGHISVTSGNYNLKIVKNMGSFLVGDIRLP